MKYIQGFLLCLGLFAFAQTNDENAPPVVLYGEKEGYQVEIFKDAKPVDITVGLLTNNENIPMRFRFSTNEPIPWLKFPETAQQTSVAPGETREIKVRVNPAMLQKQQQTAKFKLEGALQNDSAIDLAIAEFITLIVDVLKPEEEIETCTVQLKMENVTVTDGQGVGEGKLELRITGFADSDQATWPSSQGTQQVKEGQTMAMNMPISTFELEEGETITVNLQAEVLEVDSGLAGADDTGSASGTMDISCETLPVSKTLTVNIIGQNDGQVKVKYTAVRID